MTKIKVIRKVQLGKLESCYEIHADAELENILYTVSTIETAVKEIGDFVEGKVKVPKIPPKKEEPIPTSSEEAGTLFDTISADAKDFHLFNVTIETINAPKAGTNASGGEYQRQSLIISDIRGVQRELVAWNDDIALFASLQVKDHLDIESVSRVKEYKGKQQYTIGAKTEIRGAE